MQDFSVVTLNVASGLASLSLPSFTPTHLPQGFFHTWLLPSNEAVSRL